MVYLAPVLRLTISSVAILTRKLRSTSRCFLQNLKTRPHCLAGKWGDWMPCRIRATARPVHTWSRCVQTKERMSPRALSSY